MNIDNVPDDSESSDEDYVPEGTSAQLPSEEESDGDPEESLVPSDDLNTRGNKRRKKAVNSKKNLKSVKVEVPKENQSNEQQKEQSSTLWADFIKDTGFKTRAERLQTPNDTENSESNVSKNNEAVNVEKPESQRKIKITEVLEFAGEEVKIEKEVNVDSSQTRLTNTPSGSCTSSGNTPGGGKINSILNSLGKKRKINTLEKSKLDWDRFKKDENIEDELQAYSKSKDGYLERQDFLQRADLRRFEIEKEIRSSIRKNRMNNSGI